MPKGIVAEVGIKIVSLILTSTRNWSNAGSIEKF